MTSVAGILAPYRQRPAPPGSRPGGSAAVGWRFGDAPPGVVARALALRDTRMTGPPRVGRPPPGWLVRLAHELDGRLTGLVDDDGDLRVDGVTVTRARRHDLVQAVAAAWPDADDGSAAALDSAVGEVYATRGSPRPTWKGPGRALAGRISRGEVVGLWWE